MKSCYRRQPPHCSPPMQPPWCNSLQPLAHMIAPHCSRLLLLAWPDLPLKSKGGRPPSPTPALLYCLLSGRKVNTSRGLWLNLNDLGQNAGRQIGVWRKDGLFFFFFCHPFFPTESGRRGRAVLLEVEVQPKDAHERNLLYSADQML